MRQESPINVEGVGEMILCAREVVNDGWYLVSAVPSDSIYQVQSTILLMVIAFVLLALLVILTVTLLNRAIVTEPIEKIIAAVEKVQNEDYDIHLDIHTGDEIELLAQNFTVMAQRIDALVNQNLKAELQYKQAQFDQLQHQIKPHFLYNTFECINALSQLGRTDEVRTMTGSLATLMKNKMSDQRFTTVGEEFACAEAFLQIYKIMHGENLSYEVRLEPGCRNLMIPSLIVRLSWKMRCCTASSPADGRASVPSRHSRRMNFSTSASRTTASDSRMTAFFRSLTSSRAPPRRNR